MGTVRTPLTLALGLAVALGISVGAASAPAQENSAPKKAVISGMSAGVLRVPEIAVWSCAGGQMAGCNLVGKIKHGTEITRYEKERSRGLDWYRIEGAGMKGWVRDTFVEVPGT